MQVDITPREYVLDYLAHSSPTQLHAPFTDSDGNLFSRPVVRDGQPVQCRDAIERRDRLIEKLAALPPVQGALDQIVQRFGTDMVAEVTGRSRSIVRLVACCERAGTIRALPDQAIAKWALSRSPGFRECQNGLGVVVRRTVPSGGAWRWLPLSIRGDERGQGPRSPSQGGIVAVQPPHTSSYRAQPSCGSLNSMS